MSKQARKEGVDRISSLPDSILSHILSFLSTKEAARTSILSTRWRYLFALVTNPDFDMDENLVFESIECVMVENQQVCREKSKGTFKSFKSFVDRVLFFHNRTSIEKFRLHCRQVDFSCVCGWVSAAIWRDVQHLDLNVYCFGKITTLPHVLFTCNTLVTLKLHINLVLNVPNDVCLPNLKTLHLSSIAFLNDDSVKKLVSSCICLEDMVMEDCCLRNLSQLNVSNHFLKRLTIDCSGCCHGHKYWILIDAPMLVYFKFYEDGLVGFTLKNLHSLISAEIDFAPGLYEHSQVDASPFFTWINNVQSLTLSSSNLAFLLGCESVPVFSNMVQLQIRNIDDPVWLSERSYYKYAGKDLANLLRDSPELEDLVIFKVVSYLPEEVHYGLLSKVKTIEITEFDEEEYCIEMAKYFLKYAGVLEKLTIRTKLYVDQKEKFKIADELLASPRISKQCCILIV